MAPQDAAQSEDWRSSTFYVRSFILVRYLQRGDLPVEIVNRVRDVESQYSRKRSPAHSAAFPSSTTANIVGEARNAYRFGRGSSFVNVRL